MRIKKIEQFKEGFLEQKDQIKTYDILSSQKHN